jgi:pimeloyl-ACP methyl ester carboxylesterase
VITLEAWRGRGRTHAVPEGRVWTFDSGGGRDGAVVFALHGFPTASWDYAPLADVLSRGRDGTGRRFVTFDFLGYGFSDKPASYGYSLFEQADVAMLVAREMGLRKVHLVAHDMGTSVATELLARRERGLLPFEVASLVLMNGSVHIELAHLTVGQKLLKSPLGPVFARLNSRTTFQAQMRRVFARPPSAEELDAMWELVSRADGVRRLPSMIRYTEERARFRARWVGALERLDLRTLVAWGRRDPVAVMAIAEMLAKEIPGARLETWDELGHYPQVEDPARVARTFEKFWGES